MIIGLTGGTGVGKSKASQFFSKWGFEVIDYDKITYEIYTPESQCMKEIKSEFGNKILNKDQSLNRKALGDIVFADKDALKKLNNIVYKYILAYTKDKIDNSNGKKLLLDAPTLFEAALNEKCDFVVGIIADKELRLKRIMERDGIDEKTALNRINSQKDDDF